MRDGLISTPYGHNPSILQPITINKDTPRDRRSASIAIETSGDSRVVPKDSEQAGWRSRHLERTVSRVVERPLEAG